MYSDNDKTERSAETDILIVLLVLAAVAVYYYRLRAALVIVLSSAVCCVTDVICIKLRKKEASFRDVSPLMTGLTLGLMMSASAPYFAVATAAVFAIAAAKQAFGGRGCEIFDPAAAGYLFAALCFPENMLTYPEPFAELPFSSLVRSDILGASMSKVFIATGSASVSVIELLAGRFRGPMGTGTAIILAIGAIFLMCRRSVPAITLLTEVIVSGTAVFLLSGFDITSVLYFFAGGMTLFGMIFLSCAGNTVPKTNMSKIIYGIIVGGITVLMQYYSKTENAVVYAVLIAAPFGIELDKRSLSFAEMLKSPKGILHRNNKQLQSMQETLEMIDNNNGEDQNG